MADWDDEKREEFRRKNLSTWDKLKLTLTPMDLTKRREMADQKAKQNYDEAQLEAVRKKRMKSGTGLSGGE